MEQTDVLFKNKLLETFKAFIEFCNEHSIKYYACGGTLIGAVRHQGLIPWDDDIDVWMMPDDFKKFCSYRGKIQGHYDIMDGRDDNYWLLSVAKFVDVDTTLWEEEEYPCVTGVYIDVFPLYECDSQNALQQKHKHDEFEFFFKRSMRHYSSQKILSSLYNGHLFQFCEIMKDVLYYKPLYKTYKRKFDRFSRKIQNEHGDRYVSYAGDYGEGEIFSKDMFLESKKMRFEDFEIDVPKEYDIILKQLYGDYMKLPPEDKRKSHHSHYFLDLNRRWTLSEIKKYKKTAVV